MEQLNKLPLPLLLWFREEGRTLPWRSDPTPYHVWVSEIMLQQTRVAAVLGYYARFLEAFPTAEALAAAPEERLMKLWEGLGYSAGPGTSKRRPKGWPGNTAERFPPPLRRCGACRASGITQQGLSPPSPSASPARRWMATSCGSFPASPPAAGILPVPM